MPNWPIQNVWAVKEYTEISPPQWIGTRLGMYWPGIGVQLKWMLGVVFIGLLMFEWWIVWKKEFNHLLWTAYLTITIGLCIGIAAEPSDFMLLFPPLVLILSSTQVRWRNAGHWFPLGVLILMFGGLWE